MDSYCLEAVLFWKLVGIKRVGPDRGKSDMGASLKGALSLVPSFLCFLVTRNNVALLLAPATMMLSAPLQTYSSGVHVG